MKAKKETAADASFISNTSCSDDRKVSYDEKLAHVSVIAQPMASRKLTKKLYKLIKKGKL